MNVEKIQEKFIDKNIGELCMDYDRIKGAVTNLARIAPELIDGLKPVQRRALYIMYLKDKGKTFRKLASISGDTFGRIHPHAPTSISDAVVGMGQSWHNNIPLIEAKGNWGSCHDKETKVLTRYGWKYFDEITYEDKLASVDPDTGNLIFENPVNIIKYHYTGELIRGLHKSLDFAVTPDHNMIIQKFDISTRKFDENFKSVKASKLPGYSRLRNRFYQNKNEKDLFITLEEEKVSNGNILPEVKIPMDIWVQFLGIYLADGSMSVNDKDKYPYYKISITCFKERKIKYFGEILDQMGVNDKWSEGYRGFSIINKRIYKLLSSYGLEGKRAPDKFIPDFIFDLDKSYIEKFLYGFGMGDGNLEKWGVRSYYTSSKKMAEQLQILLLMIGRISKIHLREPRKGAYIDGRLIQTDRLQYHVYEWANKNQSIDRSKYTFSEFYDDYVYCAEVPTYHTLITKRNECIMLSGNCGGDPAGADRYIFGRLSEYAQACFFDDWSDSVVDMVMGYDEETMEPLYLPAKYPNVLLNGCLGIGYGLSSNIAPFNFKEVVEACILLMKDPKADIILIPDSPTGASIIENDFSKITNTGRGSYSMRCTYEIDDAKNIITITSLPYMINANSIREKIADIKEKGGLTELLDMNDLTGAEVKIELIIRDDVNPYKFMRKLIKEVAGLENPYPVNITIVNDYESFDLSIKDTLLRWIEWRREQKRTVLVHKRSSLIADQRNNDVKLFITDPKRLNEVKDIFRNGRNRDEIEKTLVNKYHNTEIRMDSMQARTVSNMRLADLSQEAYEGYLKKKEEIEKDLKEVVDLLNEENGVDKVIIAELKDGIKRFGTPRKSNVVPYKISVGTEVAGACILQLSSDGNITRKVATNVDEEPIPTDSSGFAVKVDNDSSFILIDDTGHHSFIKVRDLPTDSEVPVNRYAKQNINKNIVAMLPVDIDDTDLCCTLISRKGQIKKIRVSDMGPSKKACIDLKGDDHIVRGIITKSKTARDILIYTDHGMGQRLDPNTVRITSPIAKGGNGFKLRGDDEIVGCFAINPTENQYILYVTTKGKMRLNLIDYLPLRDSKHDAMVSLIPLNDRDKLVGVLGCNKYDKVQVFYDDGTNEIIDIEHLPESTMGSEPKKVTSKNAVTNNIVKAKIV